MQMIIFIDPKNTVSKRAYFPKHDEEWKQICENSEKT